MSLFDPLTVLPEDPILGLAPLFQKDKREGKVNLGIGTYKDAKGKSTVFEAVRKAEHLIDQESLDKEYQPIDGSAVFKEAILDLLLSAHQVQERTAVIACIGGSGSIRLAGDLLNVTGVNTIALPTPTWSNHPNLLRNIPHIVSYPYYDTKAHRIDFEGMLESLEKLPKNSFVLLHATCQNPTGEDLTLEQWKTLAEFMKKRELHPLFDFAYHGYKDGIKEEQALFTLFLEHDLEFIICYSLSKSLSLYGERVGALVIVSKSKQAKEKIISQTKALIRRNYSSPPLHGTRIVAKVVLTKELRASWEEELKQNRLRLKEMRKLLAEKIPSLNYVTKQNGLFSLLDLTQEDVLKLRNDHGIYMLDNGRINFAGLNENNIDYMVKCLSKYL